MTQGRKGKFMIVKRISPRELPSSLILKLNYAYKIELGNFVAITDNEREVLYVNHSIPQKDVDGFLEVITYPDHGVNDDETNTGIFLSYVYDQYGFGTYEALLDAYRWRMDQKEKDRAKEMAKVIVPLIEKELASETPAVEYNERLIGKISSAGMNRKGRTPKNVIGFSDLYVFYLGYLIGAGMLKDEKEMTCM